MSCSTKVLFYSFFEPSIRSRVILHITGSCPLIATKVFNGATIKALYQTQFDSLVVIGIRETGKVLYRSTINISARSCVSTLLLKFNDSFWNIVNSAFFMLQFATQSCYGYKRQVAFDKGRPDSSRSSYPGFCRLALYLLPARCCPHSLFSPHSFQLLYVPLDSQFPKGLPIRVTILQATTRWLQRLKHLILWYIVISLWMGGLHPQKSSLATMSSKSFIWPFNPNDFKTYRLIVHSPSGYKTGLLTM
jgi:hypothetical protein